MVEHIEYPNVLLFAMDLSNFENKWVLHNTSISNRNFKNLNCNWWIDCDKSISNYKDSSSGNQNQKYLREEQIFLSVFL